MNARHILLAVIFLIGIGGGLIVVYQALDQNQDEVADTGQRGSDSNQPPLSSEGDGGVQAQSRGEESALSRDVVESKARDKSSTKPFDEEDPAIERTSRSTFTGSVIDEAGNPIAGAEIEWGRQSRMIMNSARTEEESKSAPDAITDERGHYTLSEVNTRFATVQAWKSGYISNVTLVSEKSGENIALEPITLSRGVILHGKVLSPDGRGVSGAKITVDFMSEMTRGGASGALASRPPGFVYATTDENGTFLIDAIAVGPNALLVTTEKYPSQSFKIDYPEPTEIHSLDFRLQAGASIQGVLTNIPESNREDLYVKASLTQRSALAFLGDVDGSTRRAVVLENGQFHVEGLDAGADYELQAYASDKSVRGESIRSDDPSGMVEDMLSSIRSGSRDRVRSVATEAKGGASGIALNYLLGTVLTFTLIDSTTGEPIEIYRASAKLDSNDENANPLEGMLRSAMAGNVKKDPKKHPQGICVIDELRPTESGQTASLEVHAKGYYLHKRENVLLVPGETTDLGAVLIDACPILTVIVRDTAGLPIPGADVRLKSKADPASSDLGGGRAQRRIAMRMNDLTAEVMGNGSRGSRSETTNAEGIAILDTLEGKTCDLQVQADGFAGFAQELAFPLRQSVSRDVVLSQGGTIRVEAIDAASMPVTNRRIEHRPPDGHETQRELGGIAQFFTQAPSNLNTNDEGVLILENLAPGIHWFRIAKERSNQDAAMFRAALLEGLDGIDGTWSEATIVEGTQTLLVLHPPLSSQLTGIVRERGVPLAHATLSLHKEEEGESPLARIRGANSADSDESGNYSIEGVEPGTYELRVRHPSRQTPETFRVRVNPSPTLYDVDLSLTVVKGRVVDSEGRGLSGIQVRISDPNEPPNRQRAIRMTSNGQRSRLSVDDGEDTSRTDDSGRFELRGVPYDKEIVAIAEGSSIQPIQSKPLELSRDESVDIGDLVSTPGSTIKLKVTASKRPVFIATYVAVFKGDPDAKVEPLSGAAMNGEAEIQGLRPGEWSITVTNVKLGGDQNDPETLEKTIDVVQGGEVPLLEFDF